MEGKDGRHSQERSYSFAVSKSDEKRPLICPRQTQSVVIPFFIICSTLREMPKAIARDLDDIIKDFAHTRLPLAVPLVAIHLAALPTNPRIHPTRRLLRVGRGQAAEHSSHLCLYPDLLAWISHPMTNISAPGTKGTCNCIVLGRRSAWSWDEICGTARHRKQCGRYLRSGKCCGRLEVVLVWGRWVVEKPSALGGERGRECLLSVAVRRGIGMAMTGVHEVSSHRGVTGHT
ncbi:hypothetical protein FPV67DRAFT_1450279 [Lyophyllum atratum]|nr:hypothetical protein FPV67DRAFT_1450279 [Lyophyllum atratum]